MHIYKAVLQRVSAYCLHSNTEKERSIKYGEPVLEHGWTWPRNAFENRSINYCRRYLGSRSKISIFCVRSHSLSLSLWFGECVSTDVMFIWMSFAAVQNGTDRTEWVFIIIGNEWRSVSRHYWMPLAHSVTISPDSRPKPKIGRRTNKNIEVLRLKRSVKSIQLRSLWPTTIPDQMSICTCWKLHKNQ